MDCRRGAQGLWACSQDADLNEWRITGLALPTLDLDFRFVLPGQPAAGPIQNTLTLALTLHLASMPAVAREIGGYPARRSRAKTRQ